MHNLAKYVFAIVFSILSFLSFSQNEVSKWYFGGNAALDFMTSPPTILTNNAMIPSPPYTEGTSSIADAAGNLLFYTDGVRVWNQAHTIMANGSGLHGSFSSSQSALIVKQPGNANIYFVFTTDAIGNPNGLKYSVVDMTLAAGMGSVTAKNIQVFAPSTEGLCAVKHCNGNDIWVISHNYPGNEFYVIPVTASGVNPAVISAVGTNFNTYIMAQNNIKVSPNGKKIGVSLINGLISQTTGEFFICDFDNATGVVSNSLNLGTNLPMTYGIEFSPDGSKFYGALYNSSEIYQWDLCAGSNAGILASRYTINSTSSEQMQLAPNGKIYVARMNQQALGVINNPNASGAACNYVDQGQSVFPKVCSLGLPNFVSSAFLQVPPFTYTIAPAISCLTASFTAPPSTNTVLGCTASGYEIASVAWNFGDPASGTSNVSTLTEPSHLYPGPGTYTVQLILYNPCGGVISTLNQQVVVAPVPISSASGFSVCQGGSLTLSASGSVTYTWNTGAQTNTINISPATNTSYTVTATDINGCLNQSVQTVTVNPLSLISVSGNTSVCAGNVATLTANGAVSYTWSTGETSATITVTPQSTTAYTVTGSNASGCSDTFVRTVTVLPLPQVNATGTAVVCIGSEVALTVNGAATYLWSNGETAPIIGVSPIATMVYSVTGFDLNGCSNVATTTVFVNPLPVISIVGDNTVCLGSPITQTAVGASTYTWNTGETTPFVTMIPLLNNSAYEVTGTDMSGCTNTAVITLTVKPTPYITSSSAVICSGGNAALTVLTPNDPSVVYKWFPGALVGYNITVSGISTLVYTVVANAANGCTASATSTLEVIPAGKAIEGFMYNSPVCANNDSILPNLLSQFIPGGIFHSESIGVDLGTGQIVPSVAVPGTHIVTYAVTLNGCVLTDTQTIVLLPAPNLTLSPSVIITPGASAQLQVTGGDNYTWSPPNYLSCAACDSPVATPPDNMQYCVTSVQKECEAKACVNIFVSCESANDFSVPNAFTPNGDNNNDAFCLQGWNECITDFNVRIFNRWGEEVFASSNASFCWDGVYNGKLQDAAVFIYVITAKKFQSTTAFTKKGNITLIR